MKIPGSAGLLKMLSDAVVDHLRERRAALTGGRSGGARAAGQPMLSGPAAQTTNDDLRQLEEANEVRLDSERPRNATLGRRRLDERREAQVESEMTGDSPILIAAELRQLRVEAVVRPDAGSRHAMERALYAGIVALENQPTVRAGKVAVSQSRAGGVVALKDETQAKDAPSSVVGTSRQLSKPETGRAGETETRGGRPELQLVVFRLAGELYGADVSRVSEVVRMQRVTRLPETPESIEGMINVRGTIYPVIDLRKRFDVAVGETTEASRIVLVEIGGHSVGVIVDAVAQVLRVSGDKVTPLSSLLRGNGADFVEGILNANERLIILVDLKAALGEALTGLGGAAVA